MDMRILILSVVLSFFLGVSSQAGLLDTKTLPGTQPQTPVGAQQVPRGTTINPLPDLVPAHGAVSGGNVANGVCKSPVHAQLGAKNTKPNPVTTSFFIGMTLAPKFGGATASGFDLTGRPAFIVISLTVLLLLVYFILAEATVGATLGKLAAGIRVRTKEGQRISPGASVIRNLMRFIDGIGVYLVGAISVANAI